MIKVFLVDDEIVFREGVRNSFPWEDSGYTLIGEAPDGEMALTMIRDQRPDIIVTDIRMPFMDGLQLCTQVRRIMPRVGIIILSGYDDFAYARKAMALGVQEYLLKPVNSIELHDALDRVYARVQETRRIQDNAQSLRERLNTNNHFVKDRLLSTLFTDEPDEQRAGVTMAQFRSIGMNLFAKRYAVLEISFDYGGQEKGRDVGMDRLYSLSDANQGSVLVCSDKHGALALILGDTDADTEERAYAFAEAALKDLQEAGFGGLLITIGETVNGLMELPKSRKTARHLRRSSTEKQTKPMRIIGSREQGDRPEPLRNMTIRPLYEQIQYVSKEQLDDVLDEYSRTLDAGNPHSYVVRDYLQVEAFLTASRIVCNAGGDPEEVLGTREYDGGEDLSAAREVLRKAIAFREASTDSLINPAIAKARNYMAQHFQDPNLMLKDVADYAAMSCSRFSTVFSQEIGYTFTEYLTELRLSKARELLRTTELRSHQICSMVGYNDPHYFSYLFRKNTGMTPSEYRKTENPAEMSNG